MTKRDATELFSEWALRDRDLGMESGHAYMCSANYTFRLSFAV